MGNWTTDKKTDYFNVRLTSDAKHFPKNEEKKQPAATFLSIVDGTKGGEDIFIDVKVVKGAERLSALKKGMEVDVSGTVEFSLDRNGKLRGKIWDGTIRYGSATRDALKANGEAAAAAASAAADNQAAADDAAAQDDGEAPAFE